MAEKAETVIGVAATVDFILSSAIFVSGTSLPGLLRSLQLKGKSKESSVLPLANTDHRKKKIFF